MKSIKAQRKRSPTCKQVKSIRANDAKAKMHQLNIARWNERQRTNIGNETDTCLSHRQGRRTAFIRATESNIPYFGREQTQPNMNASETRTNTKGYESNMQASENDTSAMETD